MVKLSQLYSQWSPTNKIMFWLGSLGLIGAFIGGGIYYKSNVVNIKNSNLKNVLICQDCKNISFPSNSASTSNEPLSSFYTQEISINLQQGMQRKSDLFYFKFIMPDDQEAFLEEVKYNETYKIGRCNEESTDCYVYNKYRTKNRQESDICWIFLTRIGHNIPTDNLTFGQKFFKDQNLCFEDLK